VNRLRRAAPQLRGELGAAQRRARASLAHATIDGVDWYWPPAIVPAPRGQQEVAPRAYFLAPFDPVVWDRARFELFWGWAYRFEAYTPVRKRKLGYYALPLLWRDEVLGWANLSLDGGALHVDLGYVAGRAPRDRSFRREVDAEVERVRAFLGL
jgi:uncharacterized protein YcaQ